AARATRRLGATGTIIEGRTAGWSTSEQAFSRTDLKRVRSAGNMEASRGHAPEHSPCRHCPFRASGWRLRVFGLVSLHRRLPRGRPERLCLLRLLRHVLAGFPVLDA